MKNIQHARQGNIDKSLNTLVRYEQGIMTRREYIEMQKKAGARVEISTKNKIQYNRLKYNRMDGREQDVYMKKCNEKVTCYILCPPGDKYFTDITKTEHDYFLSLSNSAD